LSDGIEVPPFTPEGRREAGWLLRRLQRHESLGMPESRPMPSIGPRRHEPRMRDGEHNWRLVYRIDPDAIVLVEVFPKTTQRTPRAVIDRCKDRLKAYDELA
jgi:phage-related protein